MFKKHVLIIKRDGNSNRSSSRIVETRIIVIVII